MATNARPGPDGPHPAPSPFRSLPGARHFRAVDLASWPDAQRRYRALVQQRHPDRRPDGAGAAAHAEFIEISAAFKHLRERYRRDGTLPGPIAAAADPPPVAAEALRAWREEPFAHRRPAPDAAGVTDRAGPARTGAMALAAALALAGLLALGLTLDASLERSNRDLERTLERGPGRAPGRAGREPSRPAPPGP